MSEETTSQTTETPAAAPAADSAPAASSAPSSDSRPPRTDRGDRGGDRRGGPGGRGPGGARRRFPRRKVCYFRVTKAEYVDYKDVDTLRRFISDKGKIIPRRVTGTSAKFQRLLATAIKRARYMALIPYSGAHR